MRSTHAAAAALALLLAGCAASRPAGPWRDVAAVWISPLRTDQLALGPAPVGALRQGSIPVDVAVFREVLTRATPQPQAAQLRAGKLLLVERDDGRREFLRAETWTAWAGSPDGRSGVVLAEPDWRAWWFGVMEPAPDWDALTTFTLHDLPGSPFRWPADAGLPRDPELVAAILSRATRVDTGSARPYARLAVARFEDGSLRRLSLGEEGQLVVIDHGGTWQLAPEDTARWLQQVQLPPCDWSAAVAIRPWPLPAFVSERYPPDDTPMTAADALAAEPFRELAGRARWQRATPPFGPGNLVVVELDDGRRKALAVSDDGARFREVGRLGEWTVAAADRAAWRALVVRTP